MTGSLADSIKELLADGKPRTTSQIARELRPGMSSYEHTMMTAAVTSRLCNLAKWGQVEVIGQVRGESGRSWANVWRIAP